MQWREDIRTFYTRNTEIHSPSGPIIEQTFLEVKSQHLKLDWI